MLKTLAWQLASAAVLPTVVLSACNTAALTELSAKTGKFTI